MELQPRLFSMQVHPGCPLSAGLQVLVCEHVEFAVQPAGFIPRNTRLLYRWLLQQVTLAYLNLRAILQ